MNRRSVLRWLGLAPVAAPAAALAASAPALPPIDYSALSARTADIERNVAAVDTALARQIDEVVARANADAAQIRIITAEHRISVLEGRIGLLTARIG
ncbi:hypothetical protein C0214_13630 [Methylobacterium sp. DM1]|nr:hypothetical protein C0214_13630 [Methylobacterium sp. DM1]